MYDQAKYEAWLTLYLNRIIFYTSLLANKASSPIPCGTNHRFCLPVLKTGDFSSACLTRIDLCIETSIPVSEQDMLYVSEVWEKRRYTFDGDLDSIFQCLVNLYYYFFYGNSW